MDHRIIPAAALISLISVLLLSAGCLAPSAGEEATTPTSAPNHPLHTRAEMVSFVREAVDFAQSHEKATALATFSDPDGPFMRENLYIYAYDFNGTTIAHPVNSEKIGVNRLDELDAAGNLFIRDLRDRARDGGGFVAYYYIDPAMNRTVQPKLGYVLSVDDEWWLGSGIYGASQPDPIPCPALYATTENVTTDQLTAFVEDAADFARDAGRIRALRAFNNLSGPYVRDDLYIFAYDNEGTILALPYESDLIGSSRYDATDSNGVFYIREGIEKAGAGGGFISYTYVDPATGEETWKRSYVTPVDDRWWIGAGIYETAPAS